jgi:hypothetical protein
MQHNDNDLERRLDTHLFHALHAPDLAYSEAGLIAGTRLLDEVTLRHRDLGLSVADVAIVSLALQDPSCPGAEVTQARRILASAFACVRARTREAAKVEVGHSPDYRTVYWYGTTYSFSSRQADIVRVLWRQVAGTWDRVGQDYIAEHIDRDDTRPFRMRDAFKSKKSMHPAWDAMIVSTGKGIFSLAVPM